MSQTCLLYRWNDISERKPHAVIGPPLCGKNKPAEGEPKLPIRRSINNVWSHWIQSNLKTIQRGFRVGLLAYSLLQFLSGFPFELGGHYTLIYCTGYLCAEVQVLKSSNIIIQSVHWMFTSFLKKFSWFSSQYQLKLKGHTWQWQ